MQRTLKFITEDEVKNTCMKTQRSVFNVNHNIFTNNLFTLADMKRKYCAYKRLVQFKKAKGIKICLKKTLRNV